MKRADALGLILTAVLVLFLVLASLNKFASADYRDEMIATLDVVPWFITVVAIWELILVVGLCVSRTRGLASLASFATMIAAAWFNFQGDVVGDVNPRSRIPLTLALAACALLGAWIAAGRPRSLGALVSVAIAQFTGQADPPPPMLSY